MTLPPAHETSGKLGIVIPDPDQGTPLLHLQFAMPSTAIMVWEPFEDGTQGGHNLLGFRRRWQEWAAGDAPFLEATEPRFGFPLLIPRAALGVNGVVSIMVVYHRREDVRAGHRSSGLVAPQTRRLPDGSLEVLVPR